MFGAALFLRLAAVFYYITKTMFKTGLKDRLLTAVSGFAIICCCCVLLFPPLRDFVIAFCERFSRGELSGGIWLGKLYEIIGFAILIFGIILIYSIKSIRDFLENRRERAEKIFVFAAIVIIALSIAVRIVIYIKCRSLWMDEALLAENFVLRNWRELLTPPLLNNTSAPILYVISVKSICSIFGYSEFALRIFSLLAFIGLLFCETVLLKKGFNYSNYNTALVVAASALVPGYFWYSNEVKPYMSDVFFIVLTILTHFYYTRGRIKLPALTALCFLFLGYSSPALFFVGGVFITEFFAAVFNKNPKKAVSVTVAGLVIIAIYALYFNWWTSSVMILMTDHWNGWKDYGVIMKILRIFGYSFNYDSSIMMLFVPFASVGIFYLCKGKNRIACSTAASLFIACAASSIGKWPLAARLWLFLPAIVLIFTPSGIDAVRGKFKRGKFADTFGFIFFSAMLVYLSIICLRYAGGGMYLPRQEINPLVRYVQNNIKAGEKLYVYTAAAYAFSYKNGYGAAKIGNVTEDNIIYGEDEEEWKNGTLGNEMNSILAHDKVYLIFQHRAKSGFEGGLDILRKYGVVTEVMNMYDTPLYYFERTD